MRGRRGHSLPDAIHLATAIAAGASAFVTNDRRLRVIPRLNVVQLADLVA
jgi:predicted nucleic acid-binding protein